MWAVLILHKKREVLFVCVCECVCDLLGQRADRRFGLYDFFVGKLLLQISTRETPQMVNFIYASL